MTWAKRGAPGCPAPSVSRTLARLLIIYADGTTAVFIHSSSQHFRDVRKTSIVMAPSAEPTAILSHLHRADGSATFSQNGYTVIGVVNGPLEVQRRDELPEEAVIDVMIRPAAGVGGPYIQSGASPMWTTLTL